jgi:alkylhydroperoxidase/carboxymuconolactone decarboxylase family protein YurZ
MSGERQDPRDDAHRRLAERLSSMVLGEVTDAERAELEAHLAECEECRELLETARELREAAPGLTERLLEHPEARLLDEYAFRPETLDAEVRSWIDAHLKACKACGEAVAVLHRSAEAPEDPASSPRRRPPRRPGLLGRTVLHPAAAAVYLVAALVLLPFALRGTPEPEPPGMAPAADTARVVGPAFRLFPDEPFRGEQPAEPEPARRILVSEQARAVRVDLVTDLDALEWPDAGLRLRVFSEDGEEILTTGLSPLDVSPMGVVSIEIPLRALAPREAHHVQIHSAAGDAPPLFEARFEVAQRTGPTAIQPDQ